MFVLLLVANFKFNHKPIFDSVILSFVIVHFCYAGYFEKSTVRVVSVLISQSNINIVLKLP